jgi:hypothetical protein
MARWRSYSRCSSFVRQHGDGDGAPRHRPGKLRADKAYESRDRRAALDERDTTPLAPPAKGYERRDAAFLHLGCALICWGFTADQRGDTLWATPDVVRHRRIGCQDKVSARLGFLTLLAALVVVAALLPAT